MDLQIKTHDNGLISIRDLSNDIDISEHKWSFLFTELTKYFQFYFFLGSRLYYQDNKFDTILNSVCQEILFDSDGSFLQTAAVLNPKDVIISRRSLSELWFCYEYPSIVFVNTTSSKRFLLEQLKQNRSFDLDNIPEKYCQLYRSSEQNVLWVKTNDLSINFSK